jgi:hypothetical protein
VGIKAQTTTVVLGSWSDVNVIPHPGPILTQTYDIGYRDRLFTAGVETKHLWKKLKAETNN